MADIASADEWIFFLQFITRFFLLSKIHSAIARKQKLRKMIKWDFFPRLLVCVKFIKWKLLNLASHTLVFTPVGYDDHDTFLKSWSWCELNLFYWSHEWLWMWCNLLKVNSHFWAKTHFLLVNIYQIYAKACLKLNMHVCQQTLFVDLNLKCATSEEFWGF